MRHPISPSRPAHFAWIVSSLLTVLAVVFALAVPVSAQTNTRPEIASATIFTINEGTTAETPLTAMDAENDPLTWAIPPAGGVDGDAFSLTEAGVLSFTTAPDYESPTDTDEDNVYNVTVQVSDGTDSTTADLAVTVADVAPGLAGPESPDHPEGKRGLRIAAYTVNDDVTWSLSGDDAAQFTITGGFLRFIDPPNTGNVYNVTVKADDGTATETTDVEVTVTDVDEPGVVTLSPLKPKLGTALTATPTDPDGPIENTTWQWERSVGREGWAVITGTEAESASYTPTAADAGHYLRATATYTDARGGGKTAQAMAPHVVLAHTLSALTVSDPTLALQHDNRTFYPPFDPETLHYAARCTERMMLTLATTDSPAPRLAVDGIQRAWNQPFQPLEYDTWISESLAFREQDIRITLSGTDGARTTYTIHCLDRFVFPKLTTTKHDGAMEDLIMFTHDVQTDKWRGYLIIMDNNGVPRFRRYIDDRMFTYFRVFADETHPRARYAYSKLGSSSGSDGAEVVVLDKYFGEIASDIHVVGPLNKTDVHDFHVRPNGDYLLLAYEPAGRDLGFINDDFPDVSQTLGERESVQDSAIQLRTPDGTALFTWNSWDHMAIEDCIRTQLRPEYAHVNSLDWFDGDIVAGFRGCSKILRIDVDTGDVVWRVGLSNRSRAEWEAGETSQADRGPAPLDFVNDPVGGFCGQHGAQMLDNGTNLLVFDNGYPCVTKTGTTETIRETPNHTVSRAVEYTLDLDNDEAVFQRQHRLPQGRVTGAGGHVAPLDNGDWLISWGQHPRDRQPLEHTNVQADPDTGSVKFTLQSHDIAGNRAGSPNVRENRALPLNPVALAARVLPLEAEIVEVADFHTGLDSSPTVVVAFNQPVVDVEQNTPSVDIAGATVERVSSYIVAGAPAHAYQFTLKPTGNDKIDFTLVAGQACADDGICTAGGARLSKAATDDIPGPVTVAFSEASYSVVEGGSVDVTVRLNPAHGRAGAVEIPLAVSGTASPEDYTVRERVRFGPTETTKRITVAAHADAVVEGEETVRLGFGPLPEGVTEGSTATTTVPLTDATDASIQFSVSATQVAEGNAVTLTFSAVDPVTRTPVAYATDQTINLNLSGTAAASDYTLSIAGTTLTLPYTLTLPAGESAVTVTVAAVEDPVGEGTETIEIGAFHQSNIALGQRTLTIPASDGGLPIITIHSATSGSRAEGADLEFTLARTGGTTAALPVTVAVTESAAMLSASPPTQVAFVVGSATVTLSVPTDDDAVVEAASEVTVTVRASTTYEVGNPQAASVTVQDNDEATFTLTLTPKEIVEGDNTVVEVAIDGSVTFATDQTISLALTGEATAGEDYTIVAETLTLRAGDPTVTTTLTAVDDAEQEAAETLTVSATHETTSIDSKDLTIAASDVPARVEIAAPEASVNEGADVVYTLTRTKETELTDLPELTVAVQVTDAYGRLSADPPPTTVTFEAGATTTELRMATTNDTTILVDSSTEDPLTASAVTVTVLPAETQTPPAYTVADGADTARVMVTEDDEAEFELRVDKTAVAEGGEVVVTVTITNGVTFAESQTITIFDRDMGTAVLGNGVAVDGDYTVLAPNGSERDYMRLRRGWDSVSATILVRDDARTEAAETIRLAARHPGTDTDIGADEITIAANTREVNLQRAAMAGDRLTLTLTFEEDLDTAHPPPVTAFTVEAGPATGPLTEQMIETLTVSTRTVVLHLKEAVPSDHLVRVSYTAPTTGDDVAALQNAAGMDVESWRDEPVRGPQSRPPPRPPGPPSGGPPSGGPPAEERPDPVGYLENPGTDSFQSGIGLISGWVCEAESVEIEIETAGGEVMRLEAAYGTARLDTARRADGTPLCGDTDNGFGLLFNWNRLGVGEHTVVVLVDGVELRRATVTVTTLGEGAAAEFLADVAGTCVVADFPMVDETVTLAWQETKQNFVITSGTRPAGTNRAGVAGVGYLENPGPNSFQSGIGLIAGWVCEAEAVEIEIETERGEVTRLEAAYGTERLDTAQRKDGTPLCGDTDNGFGLLFNWNRLGAGEHTVVAYVDGAELGRATVRVTTVGEGAEEEFLRDVEGECVGEDFPHLGETVRLEWQQNSQNFVVTSYNPDEEGP